VTTPFNVSPQHWARISALFDEIIEFDAPARAAALAKLRAESPALARELEALLRDAARSNATSQGAASPVAPFTMLLNAALAENATIHLPGERFGAWALEEKIGSGGMGEVWRANRSDGLFEGSAAIKLLRSDLAASKLAARFARERSVLARLNHPNIARLLDAGVGGADNDQAFLVLELVDGLPLIDYAGAHAPRVADRVRLVRDVARAVDYAHSQLVLHRDIKPSNVLVTSKGDVKLLDFGIAAAIDEAATAETTPNLTQLTGRGLTLEYAAPEQIIGEPTVAASDTYSLGVMLFHLLTGSHPFAQSKNRMALQHAAVNEEAQRASIAAREFAKNANEGSVKDHVNVPADVTRIDADLDAIIAKSLRKLPAERYTSAAAFVSDLDAWLTRTPISIRAEDRKYRGTLWLKRNWKLATLGAVAVSAVIAGLGVSLWQRSEAIANAAIAKDEAARATKVADYMGELIQSANPDNHGGKWPSVVALLEQAEKDFDKSFNDDPKTKSLLLQRLADTNNTLNRDTVSLKQYEALLAMFDAANDTTSERAIDSRHNYADILKRLNRDDEALREFEKLEPLVRKHYGEQSQPYSSVLAKLAIERAREGRIDEARALLARSQTIIRALFPNDLHRRLDSANDMAVMLTRIGLWRDAEQALAANEPNLAQLATLRGAAGRDALIQRNNLESIRIRIGKLDGVDARLRANFDRAIELLGGDNPISYRSEELRAVLASSEGRFADQIALTRKRIAANANRKGADPALALDDNLLLLRLVATHTETMQSTNENAAYPQRTAKLIAEIAEKVPAASTERANMYRSAADTALALGALDIARDAIARARSDLKASNSAVSERFAQVERAAASLAFAEGNAQLAAQLLGKRFEVFVASKEGDSPRHATLWLQRALFEANSNRDAAARSLAASRDMFTRAGNTPPQFAALHDYVAARIGGDAATLRAAEQAVDRVFLRKRVSPWRAPHFGST
jgi:eukaryotic-like serine/threonine-protein kinase